MSARPDRWLIALGLVVIGAVAFAIMWSGGDPTTFRTASEPPSPAGTSTATAPVAAVTTATATAADSAAPYTVAMSPMGAVTFPHVPKRIVTQDANYNDILVALGVAGNLIATGYQNNFYDGFYHELPDFTAGLDPAHLTFLAHAGGGMFDKELLYALHPDVFHIDPVQLASSKGWTRAGVDEVAHNVAPFFANRYSRDDNYAGKDPYAYYTLWELSEKIAEIYHRPARITQLKAVYDGMLATITAKLPPPAQRPRLGLVFYSNGKFTPYSLTRGGFGQAQYRDVGVGDAFAPIAEKTYGGSGDAGAALDLEGLLALDPDVLIVPFAIYPGTASATSRTAYEHLLALKDAPLAKRLSAFKSARVYPGGTPLQGPVFYLFQIEMAAKQIYPQLFGAYRDDQQYPAGEQLFDRARVAAILEGRLDAQ